MSTTINPNGGNDNFEDPFNKDGSGGGGDDDLPFGGNGDDAEDPEQPPPPLQDPTMLLAQAV